MQSALLLLLVIFYLCCELKGDWVDPHSMDSNIKTKIKHFSEKNTDLDSTHCTQVVKCDSDLYLRRMVRLLLDNAYLDKEDMMGYFSGHININLSAKEYKLLIDFSLNDESREDVYSEVNSIFESAFQKTSFDKVKEMVLSFEERLHLVMVNPTTYAIISVCFILYVTYKLLTANFTWRTILKYLLFFMYVIDFMITYLQIVREEEINNMIAIKKSGTVPPECDPQKLSWWRYMKTQVESALFENPCKEYYQATYQNYRYLVAPTKVLTWQFKTLIVEPIGDLGEAFGKFGRRMFTALPWGLNVAIFPIMMIAFCIIIFIIFLFVTRPHFKVTLFHMFTIEMGEPVRHQNAHNAIERPNRRAIREVGHNANHRALIEEASNNSSSSDDQLGASKDNTETQWSVNEEDCDNAQKIGNSKTDFIEIQNVSSDAQTVSA